MLSFLISTSSRFTDWHRRVRSVDSHDPRCLNWTKPAAQRRHLCEKKKDDGVQSSHLASHSPLHFRAATFAPAAAERAPRYDRVMRVCASVCLLRRS